MADTKRNKSPTNIFGDPTYGYSDQEPTGSGPGGAAVKTMDYSRGGMVPGARTLFEKMSGIRTGRDTYNTLADSLRATHSYDNDEQMRSYQSYAKQPDTILSSLPKKKKSVSEPNR